MGGGTNIPITIYPDFTNQVQQVLKNLPASLELILSGFGQVLSPLLSSPTNIQIVQAKTYIQKLITEFNSILSTLQTISTSSANTLVLLANDLVSFLTTKGQTRYVTYLNNADFTNAFQKVDPSEGTNLMTKLQGIVNG